MQGQGLIAGVMAVLVGLSACAPVPGPALPDPDTLASAPPPSRDSLALARYFNSTQTRLQQQGLLRTDNGARDVPFSTRNLVDNFERIALFDEYTLRGGRFVAEQTPSRLRRWTGPVRVQLLFGPSVSPARRAKDTADTTRYIARLARITGHDIRMVTSGGNYHVLMLNLDEQRRFGPTLQDMVPGIGEATIREVTNLPRSTFCSVYALSSGGSTGPYTAAVAMIRAEHPDLLRLSCLHEELAQGLGLANDSPKARPSIFNDDEEFAFLTRHDELLLQMLYDRRLQLGMTPNEARPIITQIASELLGGES